MTKKVRIGCASAFWGDTDTAAPQLVHHGEIDYLVFDYLAEVTMSILAGAKQKDQNLGYATDFIEHIGPLLHLIKEKKIKVISNAGGMNLKSCRDALLKIAKDKDLEFQIAIVEGDNIVDKQEDLRSMQVKEIDSICSCFNHFNVMCSKNIPCEFSNCNCWNKEIIFFISLFTLFH